MPKSFNPAKQTSVFAVRHIKTKQFVIKKAGSYYDWTKNPSTYTLMINAEYALKTAAYRFNMEKDEFEIVEYEVKIEEVATHHIMWPNEDQS